MAVNKILDKIIYTLFEKKTLKKYFVVLVALFVSAINYNLFIYPAKIVAGGGNGLSIIFQTLFNFKPSIFILIFSTTTLIVAVLMIGIQKSSGAIMATFIYPLFVDLTSGITNIISINDDDMILICIFAGLVSGLVSGVIYKMGYSGGGVSLVSKILYEKLRISISKTSFSLNMIIVVAGGVLYGIENIMYAVIFLYIDRLIAERVLLGISNNKVFYIVTNKDMEVKQFLLKNLGYKITEFDVVGGYKDKEDVAIMIVVPTKDYFRVTDEIKKIDDKVFFVVTDSYESSINS